MALSFVGGGTGSSGTGGNITLTLTAGIAQNDVVYVAFGIGSTTDKILAMTTAGYTKLAEVFISGTNLAVFRKVMGATPDSQAVCTGSGDAAEEAGAAFHVWRGADTTTPEDATTTTATGTAAAPDSPSITTVTDAAIVLAIGANAINDASVRTAPTGYGNAQSVAVNGNELITVGMASKSVSPAGAENPAAWTAWDTADWGAATVAIRPATAVPDLIAGPLSLPRFARPEVVGY